MIYPLRRHRVVAAVAAIVIAVTLALTGCAQPATVTNAPLKAGGTLTFGRLAAVNDLDLHTQITANNAFAIDNIFEPLVSFDDEGEITNWLAEEHTVSSDGLTYTFTLHDGVRYSDGTELRASDVKFSFERNLKLEGPLKITAPIESIDTDDASRTVTITLREPHTPFLSELTSFSAGIIPADFGGKTETEFFKKPIGTGAFAIAKWDPVGDLTFVKNEHYWQSGLPLIDKLVYTVADGDAELLRRLTEGELDAVEIVPAENANDVRDGDTTQLLSDESWGVEQLFFNTQKPEFSDVHVRRAIAHALDLDTITREATFGTAQAASSLLPPSIEYSAAGEGFELDYDLDTARKELAASKYAGGFKATLLISSGNSVRTEIAQQVQEALKPLDIAVSIEEAEPASFRERFKSFDYDFMINTGQSDAPDPNGMVTFQTDPDGYSHSFWTNYTSDEVTKLMHEGRTTPDGDERRHIYLDIQEILARDVPYIPIYYAPNLHGATAGVAGLITLPNGSVKFQEATVSR